MWIEEPDLNLLTDLFEIDKSRYNEVINGRQKKTVTDGVSIQYVSHYVCDSFDMPSWVILTIEIGKNVALPLAVGILSSYLYDKLKNRKDTKVIINNQQVEINAIKIEKLILTNINIVYSEENATKETEKK